MADFSAWKPEDWTAAGTLVTAAVALVAASFAGWQVWEVRRTRSEQARPFVFADIQSSTTSWNALNLVIENIGTTVAHNVKVTFNPPLESTRDDRLSKSVLIEQGISTLPPRRRVEVFFDQAPDRLAAELPLRFDVVVTFEDYKHRRQEPATYVIDLTPFYNVLHLDEYTIHHAAKALREMHATMKKWTQHQSGIRVWTRDEDRRLLNDKIEHDLTGHRPVLGRAAPSDLVMALGRSVIVGTMTRNARRALMWLGDKGLTAGLIERLCSSIRRASRGV